MTRLVLAVICPAFLIATFPAVTRAQTPTSQMPPKVILTANPLGFLQFGPTVEAEALAGRTRFVTGLRIPTLGLLAHVIDPELGFSWLGIGGIRFGFDSTANGRGWWAGPRGEWGKANSGGSVYTTYGAGLEVGHTWMLKNRRIVSAGAIAGFFKSDSGLEGRFIMGVLSLGVAR